jgi:hypothetical protein
MKSHLPPNIRYQFVNLDKRNTDRNADKPARKMFDFRCFLLKNLFKNTISADVEKYAFYLTGLTPISSNCIDIGNGIWLVRFGSNFSEF